MKASIVLALALAAPAWAQPSPYAGQETRGIKSLPDAEVRDLLAGQGMSLAKAAELNGYPGPAHVLEHAEALQLTSQQRLATEALMQRHKAEAKALGRLVVEAEQALDRAFATRSIDEALLARLTAEVGLQQARLRQEHLRTHLLQTALLDERQVREYGTLRGYAGGATTPPAGHGAQRGHHGSGVKP